MKNNKNMKQLIERYDIHRVPVSCKQLKAKPWQHTIQQIRTPSIPTTPHRFSKEYAPSMLFAHAKKHAMQPAHPLYSVQT